jgi:hypothetical protein
VSLFASVATVPPRLLLDNFVAGPAQRGAVQLSLSADGRVAPGDDVVVALVARDLAGNASAHISHVRAQPLAVVAAADTPIDELPGGQCVVAAAPRVRVPARVPANPSLRVTFPFEPVPLALVRDDDGSSVPLVPGDDVVDDGVVEGGAFAPARPLSPGAWRLVSLPCDRCVCPACTAPLAAPLVVDDVIDTAPPAPPIVDEIIDDPQPIPSSPDCAAPHAGTLVVLAPGVDDVSAALDLTYDAVLRLGDEPPRVVGRGLLPLARADGSVVVRLPTSSFGRIIDAAFTLELTARDAAGNASSATFRNAGRSLEAGCGQAASASTTSTTSLALLAIVLRRRHRRRR